MGYFAIAQYDVLFLYVILNEVKNPTEELTGHILLTLVVGYFAALNMTESPLSALRATSPEGGSKVCFYCLCEGVKRPRQSPGRVGFRKAYTSHFSRGIFR